MFKVLKAILGLSLLFSASKSFATVDGLTEAWIVVQNVQDDEEFRVQKVPVMGCWGLSQGPQLAQFTSEYMVKINMGCGGFQDTMENINSLSCGQITDSVESDDYSSFKKITLDISKCSYKDNKQFITMVRTAAARNFPQTRKGKVVKSPEVELVIIK